MKIVFLNPVDVSVCPMRKQNPAVAAAAISALGSLASDVLSAGANVSMNKATRDWQHNESLIGRQWQEDMYNKYQSPKALVSQQIAAGINPFISDTGTGGSMPSTEVPSAPTPPSLHFDNALGAGVDSYLKAQSVQAANSSYLADAKMKTIQGATYLAEHISESSARRFLESNLFNLDDDSQFNVTKQFNLNMQAKQLQVDQQNFEFQLEKAFGEKERQAKLNLVNEQINVAQQSINKMAEEISLLQKQGKLTLKQIEHYDAQIKELATRCASNLAQAGFFRSQSTQIDTLLPYVKQKMSYDNSILSNDVLMKNWERVDREALFVGDTEKRRRLKTSDYQTMRAVSAGASPENNPVTKYLQELGKALPGFGMVVK